MICRDTGYATAWPNKFNLFGVQVSAVSCDEACDAIMTAAHRRAPGVVSAFDVHALIEASTEQTLTAHVNHFGIVVPDGQPVRWALNWLHGANLERNVRGSELMWRLCERAAEEDVSVYLYGSSPDTLRKLEANLRNAFPGVTIAGIESPPFRPLTPDEDAAMVERVNASGAGLMFVGLGSPKQDYFAAAHADRIHAMQLCVGAAFDFHAGTKATAPAWMQRHGLEWVFRLVQEPRRLWKRYLVSNTTFVIKLATQSVQQFIFGADTSPTSSSSIEIARSTPSEPHTSMLIEAEGVS